MKAHFLLISLFASIQILSGQTSKGDWLLNGGLIFSHYSIEFPEPGNHYSAELQPRAGYFFANGLAAGASFFINSDFRKIRSKGILPFVRGQFGKGKFRPFVQADGGWIWTTQVSTGRQTLLNFKLGAGIFLSENAALEPHLNYNAINSYHLDGFPTFKRKDGLTFGLGLNYFLPRNSIGRDSFALLDDYLSKGSASIGANAIWDFDNAISGDFYWQKMLTERLRLNLSSIYFLWYGGGEDLSYLSFYLFTAEVQPFLALKKSTFFSPGVGFGCNPAFTGKPFEFENSAAVFVRPALHQFFRRGLLEMGGEVRRFFGDEEFWGGGFEPWTATIFLNGEFFVAPRLSLRGEIQSLLTGSYPTDYEAVFDNAQANTRFKTGFHYFFIKRNKN